ncbi:hypothetical protein ACHAXS_001784 [Conticribra weissflogii]
MTTNASDASDSENIQNHDSSQVRAIGNEANSSRNGADYFVPTATLVEEHPEEQPLGQNVINAELVIEESSAISSSTTTTTHPSYGNAALWKRLAILSCMIALVAVGISIGLLFGSRNNAASEADLSAYGNINQNEAGFTLPPTPGPTSFPSISFNPTHRPSGSLYRNSPSNQPTTTASFSSVPVHNPSDSLSPKPVVSLKPSDVDYSPYIEHDLPPDYNNQIAEKTSSSNPITTPTIFPLSELNPTNIPTSSSISKTPSDSPSIGYLDFNEEDISTGGIDSPTINDGDRTPTEVSPSTPPSAQAASFSNSSPSLSLNPTSYSPSGIPPLTPLSSAPTNNTQNPLLPLDNLDAVPGSSPTDPYPNGPSIKFPTKSMSEIAKLLSSDGAALDNFGTSVAIYSTTVVVGAEQDGDNQSWRGSAYVFVQNEQTGEWMEEAKLLPSDGAPNDNFGRSVAIHNDTIVVSSPLVDADIYGSAAVYVFTREKGIGNWREEAKLLASDGNVQDSFGCSVGIYSDTLIVGANRDDDNGVKSGAVYVFIRQRDANGNSIWVEEAKLVPLDGTAGDTFGDSVGIHANTLVVGSSRDGDNEEKSGSAYVFVRNKGGGIWIEEAKLVASDGSDGDTFGYSVAIYDDVVVVGNLQVDDNESDYSVSAYVFDKDEVSGEWMEQAILMPSDGARDYNFGNDVTIFNNTVVVGLTDGDNEAAYVFNRDIQNGTWEEEYKLLPSDGEKRDYFGQNVAVYGDTIIVGSSYDDDNGRSSGSVYCFVIT